MVRRADNRLRWLSMLVAGLLITSSGFALNDGDVAAMDRACEAARQEALAPIRAERTRTCIEQQLRAPQSCETYYKTYGNVGRSPTGAPSGGYFYDLPPCREWLQAREALRQSRSRP